MSIKNEILKKINKQITINWIANNNGTDFFHKSGLCEIIFYNRNQKEIWQIINNEGGIVDFLKHDNDQQYIEDDKSFKTILSWLSVEFIAQNIKENVTS